MTNVGIVAAAAGMGTTTFAAAATGVDMDWVNNELTRAGALGLFIIYLLLALRYKDGLLKEKDQQIVQMSDRIAARFESELTRSVENTRTLAASATAYEHVADMLDKQNTQLAALTEANRDLKQQIQVLKESKSR